MTCARCGQPISESARFYPTCGERVPAPGELAGPSAGAPSISRRHVGFWRRVLAHLIDAVVLLFLQLLVLILPRDMALLVTAVTHCLYFAVLESSPWQGTLGKIRLDLRVTDLAGRRIGFGRALGRYFSKWLSALIVGIGFLMVGWTRRKQGLHDMMAGTLVVQGRYCSAVMPSESRRPTDAGM